jgi:hypothetical protein
LILTAGAAFGVNPKSRIADIDARPDRLKLPAHKSRFVAYDFALEAAQRNGESHNKGHWQAPIIKAFAPTTCGNFSRPDILENMKGYPRIL